MPEKDKDELLKSAIPIDEVEGEEELLENAIPIDQVEEADDDPGPEGIDLAEPESDDTAPRREIRAFGPTSRHEEKWHRTPNTTGQGAIHVRTFVSKLRLDAIEHMDEQVNEWLDAHPQYEVKYVTTSVGALTGKTKEEAMFMTVWV